MKTLTMKLLKFLMFVLLIISARRLTLYPMDMSLYYKGSSFERRAETKSDYFKALEYFKKFLKTTDRNDDIEIISSCYYSVGSILLKKLHRPLDAYPFFQKIIRSYPDSSWFSLAHEKIAQIAAEYPVARYRYLKVSLDTTRAADIIHEIFSVHSGKTDSPTSYRVKFSGFDLQKDRLHLTAAVKKNKKCLFVNNVGILFIGHEKYLLFNKNMTFHRLTRKSPDSLNKIYTKIMEKFAGLMFLAEPENYDCILSYKDDQETLDYVSKSKQESFNFSLILDRTRKQCITSISFVSKKQPEKVFSLEVSEFETGIDTVINLKKYRHSNTRPTDNEKAENRKMTDD